MRWDEVRKVEKTWDEIRWDEMGWHGLRWQWDAMSRFQEQPRCGEIRSKTWDCSGKSRDGTASNLEAQLLFRSIGYNFRPRLARELLVCFERFLMLFCFLLFFVLIWWLFCFSFLYLFMLVYFGMFSVFFFLFLCFVFCCFSPGSVSTLRVSYGKSNACFVESRTLGRGFFVDPLA